MSENIVITSGFGALIPRALADADHTVYPGVRDVTGTHAHAAQLDEYAHLPARAVRDGCARSQHGGLALLLSDRLVRCPLSPPPARWPLMVTPPYADLVASATGLDNVADARILVRRSASSSNRAAAKRVGTATGGRGVRHRDGQRLMSISASSSAGHGPAPAAPVAGVMCPIRTGCSAEDAARTPNWTIWRASVLKIGSQK